MQELSGYEATAAIRAREGSGWRTPIIAMTAGARREDRERCLAWGMDGYLAKPIAKDALLALVAGFIQHLPAIPESATRDGRPMTPEPTVDEVVLDQLRVLDAAADHDFLGELVAQFVHDTEPMLVELRAAIEMSADAEALGRIAHRIKGSAGQLGGRRLASSCARLETEPGTSQFDRQIQLRRVESDYQDLHRALTQQPISP
jgi:CheY-like chemotaxis protein